MAFHNYYLKTSAIAYIRITRNIIKESNNINKLVPCFSLRLPTFNIHSFIHSGHFYSAASSPQLLRSAPDHSTYTVSEFHAKAPQATISKGLAKGLYVAARAGDEPTTLRLRVIDLTNASPRPTFSFLLQYLLPSILLRSLIIIAGLLQSSY